MNAPAQVGRYEILSELGRGGMAVVYRAWDPRFERHVAIKILPAEFLHEPDFRARFEREAKTIAALEHPAVVPVYDFGEDGERLYLVMRLMMGGSLADRLQGGALPVPQVAEILARIGAALDLAHSQGIIHRDLKPGNILFDQYGEAYLSDFGIARLAQAHATLTGSKAALGTPGYMSPEQIQGEQVDARSDIYALGVIVFEMLTGERPFPGDSPAMVLVKQMTENAPHLREVKPDLPVAYDEMLARAMARDRDRRPGTAGEVAALLGAVAGATSTAAAQLATAAQFVAGWPGEPEDGTPPTAMDTPPGETGKPVENAVAPSAGGIAGESVTAGEMASEPAPEMFPGRASQEMHRDWRRGLWLAGGLLVVAALLLLAVWPLLAPQEGGEETPEVAGKATGAAAPAEEQEGELSGAEMLAADAALPDLLEAGEYEAVVDRASAMLGAGDESAELYSLRGHALWQLGELEAATEDLRRALELDPENLEAQRQLSQLMLQREAYPEALALINEVIQGTPTNPEGYYQRGVILREMGDFSRAARSFQRYAQLAPPEQCAECLADAQHFLETHPPPANLALDRPVVASSAATPATHAVDGDLHTMWEATGGAPQWIQIDLETPTAIRGLQLFPNPESNGRVRVRASGQLASGELQPLAEIAGLARDGQPINFLAEESWPEIEVLRLETAAYPGQVVWREIAVFGEDLGELDGLDGQREGQLPGEETVPPDELAPEMPWLPLDPQKRPATALLAFNLARDPCENLLVRQALALATDRRQLAEVAQSAGFAEPQPATTFTHPDTLGRNLFEVIGLPFNPEEARALLAEAGYPAGEGLAPLVLLVPDDPEQAPLAETIAAVWREVLGIEVGLEFIATDYFAALESSRPGLYMAQWVVEANDPHFALNEAFHSGAPFNLGGFRRDEFDGLMAEAAERRDEPLTRQGLYLDAEALLVHDEAAIIPLFHYYQAP